MIAFPVTRNRKRKKKNRLQRAWFWFMVEKGGLTTGVVSVVFLVKFRSCVFPLAGTTPTTDHRARMNQEAPFSANKFNVENEPSAENNARR